MTLITTRARYFAGPLHRKHRPGSLSIGISCATRSDLRHRRGCPRQRARRSREAHSTNNALALPLFPTNARALHRNAVIKSRKGTTPLACLHETTPATAIPNVSDAPEPPHGDTNDEAFHSTSAREHGRADRRRVLRLGHRSGSVSITARRVRAGARRLWQCTKQLLRRYRWRNDRRAAGWAES